MNTKSVSFESDGVELYGLLHVPDRIPARVVIVCHGFDKRGFHGVRLFKDMAEAACRAGFVSLMFDFRGCGQSSGEFGYGWGEQEDLEAAVEFLLGRSEVKGKSGVYVVGHSLGGAVALYVAEGDRRIKGVALWAVPHDHAYNIKRLVIRSRGRFGWFLFSLMSYVDVVVPVGRLWSLRVWGFSLRPRDVRQRLMKLKEAEVLKQLRYLPVLIVNGSGDTLASEEEARRNFEAASGPKELVVIESINKDPKRMEEAIANHVFQGSEKEAVDRTLAWLRSLVRA